MTVTRELIDEYKEKSNLRYPSLSLVIERAESKEDVNNMLFTLGGFYTKYSCDECDAPLIREFKAFDYFSSAEVEGDIYRCLNGHRFQVGGKFFSGVKRIDEEKS